MSPSLKSIRRGSTAPDADGTGDRRVGLSRRGFLLSGAAAGGALAIAACSSDKKVSTTTTTAAGKAPTTAATAAGDAKVAALAASLEVLAVSTYTSALAAAKAAKLGTVPEAVSTYATAALSNHQAALDKWNSVLTAAGAQPVSQPPASLKATIDQKFAQVTDTAGLAKLALLLEQTASDTYLSAIPTLQSKDAITLAGQLQIVDQEHAAVLHYVLGEYPVPDVFQNTDLAFSG